MTVFDPAPQSSQEHSKDGLDGHSAAGTSAEAAGQVKTYVLDTSVLLSDPKAMLHFAEHEVIIPVTVVSELEHKRHDPELGYYARQCLRLLDDLRVTHGMLDRPIPLNDEGGLLVVELNNTAQEVLPLSFRGGDNDSRILAVAKSFADQGRSVTVVSKDLPMRVKASAMGIDADEYRNEWVADTGWDGMREIAASEAEVGELFQNGHVEIDAASELPANTGLVISSAHGSALGRVRVDAADRREVRLVRGDKEVFGLHGRSAEQ
ncbi:MAG TPA: PhoH family protein, partial [Candidatus Nesterenkonia stercoripullorum]|nr:PhoH family protein [Candidatus Nesterenkonia stercoripullorum]